MIMRGDGYFEMLESLELSEVSVKRGQKAFLLIDFFVYTRKKMFENRAIKNLIKACL